MKKSVSVIAASLILTLAFSAAADEADISSAESTEIEEIIQTAEPTEYRISLDEAIKMAYDGNAQLEANELEQYGNEISIASAKQAKNGYKNITANVSSNFELYCMKNGYYVDAAEMALRISQSENSKIKGSIAYNVTESYYNLVLMQKLVNAAQNSYELALDNKAVVDAQYNLGMIPTLDYQNADLTVTKCKNALDSYKLNMSLVEQNLKILINKDEENCTVIPTDEIECTYYTSDTKADISSALLSRYDLNALKEQRDLAEKYFDMATVLTSNSATYNTAYASFMKADYNYTHTSKLIALSIQQSYNDIITKAADMETAKSTYEMKLREYESSKLKYELGMITNLELTASINDLYSAQVSYANAKLSYRLAVEKYKYEISIGL